MDTQPHMVTVGVKGLIYDM